MVTLAQKTLVQQSFAVVVPIAEDVTALFYERLFEIDPSLRHLFAEDLGPQRGKLAQMLLAAVKGLDRPSSCCRSCGTSDGATSGMASPSPITTRWVRLSSRH